VRNSLTIVDRRTAACNSTYKKLAFQWLNEALFFVSSFVVAESLALRNRQLLVAAKRWQQLGCFVDSVGMDELSLVKSL